MHCFDWAFTLNQHFLFILFLNLFKLFQLSHFYIYSTGHQICFQHSTFAQNLHVIHFLGVICKHSSNHLFCAIQCPTTRIDTFPSRRRATQLAWWCDTGPSRTVCAPRWVMGFWTIIALVHSSALSLAALARLHHRRSSSALVKCTFLWALVLYVISYSLNNHPRPGWCST